ncbi:hypothetical protein EV421DRAFT_1742995 [Armillaria borealis]|uniref:Uncharacterized protein n=1 Tax=Armillaria borealis TaxID=47425 RepID=A0AA39IW34_9AGAR|nr:hypothetical protein EV421DRAFT_1742995 [Armillaria borealis]
MNERRAAELPDASLILEDDGADSTKVEYSTSSQSAGNFFGRIWGTEFRTMSRTTNSGEDVLPGRLYARRIDALNYQNLGSQGLFHVEPEPIKLGTDLFNEHIHQVLNNCRQAREELLPAIEMNLAEMKPLLVTELYGSYGLELFFWFMKHIPGYWSTRIDLLNDIRDIILSLRSLLRVVKQDARLDHARLLDILFNRFMGVVSSTGLVTPTESQITHGYRGGLRQSACQIRQVFVLGFGSTILEYLYLGDDISDGLLPRGVIGVDMSTTYEITPAATTTEHRGVIHDPSSIEAGSNMTGDFPSGAGSDNLTSSGSDTTGNLPSGDESGE